MANKFDKHFAKKKENLVVQQPLTPQKTIQVGAGLLSEASIQQAKEMQSIFVLPADIDKAEENKGISINKINELAESIMDVGLINPLVVRKKPDGRYKIVAGERRFTSISKLIEENKWAEDRAIKCSLFDPDLIDLPLSDEDKEEYVRVTENAEQRDMTDGDKLLLMRKLKDLYKKLREQGLYRGVETRDLLAADMKIGKSTVSQYQKVENQGSEKLKGAMINGAVSISTAVEMASMEKPKQDDLIDRILNSGKADKITRKDVQKYQYEERNQDRKKANPVSVDREESQENREVTLEDENKALLTDKSLKNEMKSIFKYLKDNNGIKISDDDLLTIMNKIRDIEKIIKSY